MHKLDGVSEFASRQLPSRLIAAIVSRTPAKTTQLKAIAIPARCDRNERSGILPAIDQFLCAITAMAACRFGKPVRNSEILHCDDISPMR